MKWYYKVMGGHTHVRVFMNGAKCGDLVFRNEEFKEINPTGQPGFRAMVGNCPVEFLED